MDSIKINVSPSSFNGEQTQTVKKPKPLKFWGKLVKPIDYLLRALVLITIFALPLVFSPQTFDVINLPKQSFLAVTVLTGLILWLLKMVLARDFNLRRTPLDLPILIFGAIYLIASLVSISPLTMGDWIPVFLLFCTLSCFIIW